MIWAEGSSSPKAVMSEKRDIARARRASSAVIAPVPPFSIGIAPSTTKGLP